MDTTRIDQMVITENQKVGHHLVLELFLLYRIIYKKLSIDKCFPCTFANSYVRTNDMNQIFSILKRKKKYVE